MRFEIKKESIKGVTHTHRVYHSTREMEVTNIVAYTCSFSQTIAYVTYYKSGWGNEYRKVNEMVNKVFALQSLKGRSTTDYHTYFEIHLDDGTFHSFHTLYSGNWQLQIDQVEEGCELRIGYSEDFAKTIVPNCSFSTFEVAYVKSEDEASCITTWQTYVQAVMLQGSFASSLPVVYNHWWAYEDKAINEQVFLENLKVAKTIGVEAMVLDAGWFGDGDHWFDMRGDWDVVNRTKFPRGIRALADEVHKQGMKFGFWIEIEGLGVKSKLYQTHPEFVAKRDGESLHYICFGNAAVVQWMLNVMANIIESYTCDWIKFDFNLDPQLGCDCLHHGHQAKDGLDAHIQGLYGFFAELHRCYPHVVFENCSSGGQRSDLKLVSYFHCNFLSDPDNVLHRHRCVQGAGKYMPANRQFHFMPSHTCGDETTRPFRNSDLQGLSLAQRREKTRIGMLTFFGISHRLIAYDADVLNFLKAELRLYKQDIRRFVQAGVLQTDKVQGANIYKYRLEQEYLIFIFANRKFTIDQAMLRLPATYTEVYDLDDASTWSLTNPKMIDFKQELVKTFLVKQAKV